MLVSGYNCRCPAVALRAAAGRQVAGVSNKKRKTWLLKSEPETGFSDFQRPADLYFTRIIKLGRFPSTPFTVSMKN